DLYYAIKLSLKDPGGDARAAPENFELVHAIRVGKSREFTAPTPLQPLCTEADELFPWITADGRELYFSRATKDGWRLLAARRPGKTGAFEKPRLVAELPVGFHHATLTPDGRTMFLQGPLPGGRWGLFRTTRRSGGAWDQPEPLDTLNDPKGPQG